MPDGKDLFERRFPDDRLHSAFRALRDSPFHGAARTLMNALYARMGDRNRAFLTGFQTEGFHSHLFELACYAYLEEAHSRIERLDPSPDFLLTTANGDKVVIEAATANPATGRMSDISLRGMRASTPDEIVKKVEYEFPARMRSVLTRKLMHNYHELPQCRGIPLVLMIGPFFEPGSTTYVDISLVDMFYRRERNDIGSVGFFNDPAAEQISGVLYTNAFTVSRFLRIATNWNTADFIAEREGVCYREDDPDSTYGFRYRMGAPETPRETWAEGVTLFLNPNAVNPLSAGALQSSCVFSADRFAVFRHISGFHPVTSATFVHPRSFVGTDAPTLK